MWIVLEQFFRPPYTIMYVAASSREPLPYYRKIGIRLRKVRCHLVSEGSMLFDGTPMVKSAVSVTDLYTFISPIIGLPFL